MSSDILENIILYANSSDENLRNKAIIILSELLEKDLKKNIKIIIKLVTGKNRNGFLTVEKTLKQLYSNDPTDLLPFLRRWIKHYDHGLRLLSVSLLQLFDIKKSPEINSFINVLINDKDKEVKREIINYLCMNMSTISSYNINLLKKWIKDEDQEIQWISGKTLGKLGKSGSKQILNIIKGLIEDKSEEIRWGSALVALNELSKYNLEKVLLLLKELVETQNKDNLKMTLAIGVLEQILERVEYCDCENIIKDWMNSPNKYIRNTLINSLGRIKFKGKISLLKLMSKAKYVDIRSKAAYLLGELYKEEKNIEIITTLYRMSKDKSKTVQNSAKDVLKSLKP